MQKITSKLLLRIAAIIMLLHTIGHTVGSAGWQNPNGKVPADVVQKMQNTHFVIQGKNTTMAMSFSGMNYIASVFLLSVTCTLWIFSNRTGKDASIILITVAAAIACVAVIEWLFFFPGVAFLSLAASVLTFVSVYKLNKITK